MAKVRPIPVIEERCYDWAMWDYGAIGSGRTSVQFRDNKLCLFDAGGRPPDERDRKNFEKIQRKTYQGKMTRGAQKRMSKALTHISQVNRPKWKTNPCTGKLFLHHLSFITLTVSDIINIDARDGMKNLLTPFLDWLTRTHKVKMYVWKAEIQERGQLHYHIIVPVVLHWRAVRHKWNRLQAKAGYLDDFARRFGHADPNSTDIHNLDSVDKGTDYMMKELGKDADARVLREKSDLQKQLKSGKITRDFYDLRCKELDENLATIRGKIWDCSAALNDPYYTLQLTFGMYQRLKNYLAAAPGAFIIGERFALVAVNFANPPPWLKMYLNGWRSHNHIINSGGRSAVIKKYG